MNEESEKIRTELLFSIDSMTNEIIKLKEEQMEESEKILAELVKQIREESF